MEKISRSIGITKSEKYLAKLSDRTFLNLWSYPNVYRKVGKELCDLLVVCGEHIIIFSVKDINFSNGPIERAWLKWYRKAIKKSAKSLFGAERWITECPEQVFLDAACKRKFPLHIYPNSKIHLIVVAHGAGDAALSFFNEGSGSLMIFNSRAHNNALTKKDFDPKDYPPFTVGDICPSKNFVHILDDWTLDIVMKELDTVTDFVDYLSEKAAFVRSPNFGCAGGEEDLLAYYVTHMVGNEKHGFPHYEHRHFRESEILALGTGIYQRTVKSEQYSRKKEANEISYLWDKLILAFTKNIEAGTIIVPEREMFNMEKYIMGVRWMAQEPRYLRRTLSIGIQGLLERSRLQKENTNFRCVLPGEGNKSDTGYVFLTLAHPKEKLENWYQQYRQVRSQILHAYCLGILRKYPDLPKVVGIAMESLSDYERLHGGSEDMCVALQPEKWTPNLVNDLDRFRQRYNILQDDKITFQRIHTKEYPDV